MQLLLVICLNILLLAFCGSPLLADVQHKFIKRGNTADLYPDIQITDRINVAGIRIEPLKTVYLKSIAAVEKKDGRCAVAIDYEIYNKGAININNRFYSTIETYGNINSSRLIEGIGAGESKIIESVLWLNPGELTNAVIFLDNHDNVREKAESNNTKEITLLLTGDCETELTGTEDKADKNKGLLDRFEFRIQE